MPRYTNLSRFLLTLLFASGVVDGFGRPRSHRPHRKSSDTVPPCSSIGRTSRESSIEEPNEPTTIDYNPYYHCGLVGFGVVKKIPYGTFTHADSPIDVNFSSACVRCGMCLAIAERINQTLLAVHTSMLPNQWLEDDEADLLFRVVCSDEFRQFVKKTFRTAEPSLRFNDASFDIIFRSYALREIDGERYIGDSVPGAILVVTTADGFWERNMRKKCEDILDEVGARELYEHWRDWHEKSTGELTDLLCRGESGGLRDCRSIDGDGRRFDVCQNVYHAGIRLTAKFG